MRTVDGYEMVCGMRVDYNDEVMRLVDFNDEVAVVKDDTQEFEIVDVEALRGDSWEMLKADARMSDEEYRATFGVDDVDRAIAMRVRALAEAEA